MSAEFDRRHAILRELGLSDYAARAYLALLELGPAEARDVSRLAKVPVAKVYSTLDQLASRGFCMILPEMPKRYAPESMERVMERIERSHLDEAARARAQASELAALFPIAPKDHAGDRGSAIILRGRRAAVMKSRQLAERASDVLGLASDQLLAREARALGSAVGSAHRLLRMGDANAAPLVESVPAGVELRALPDRRGSPQAVSVRVYDEDAVLFTHHVPDDASEHNGQDVAILVLEQAIVRAVRDLLELAWDANAAAPRATSRTG